MNTHSNIQLRTKLLAIALAPALAGTAVACYGPDWVGGTVDTCTGTGASCEADTGIETIDYEQCAWHSAGYNVCSESWMAVGFSYDCGWNPNNQQCYIEHERYEYDYVFTGVSGGACC